MFMRNGTGSKLLFSVIALAILSGCGGTSFKSKKATSAALSSDSGILVGGAPVVDTTEGTKTTTGTSGTTNTNTNTGVPASMFRVGAVGYTSTTVTVYAKDVLKVKFSPGIQDEKIAGTGASPQYSGLGVYITVGSESNPTAFLSNGLNGGKAETSTVMDFSNSFTKTCAADNSGCRESVTITISKPNYDYWCINYGAYCPWTRVYESHPWHGTLTVQTDGTNAI